MTSRAGRPVGRDTHPRAALTKEAFMRRRVFDRELDVLAARLQAVGVDRRGFLRIAAGLAAMGAAGFNARPAAATPKLAPGEKLAKEQTFRYGGGGFAFSQVDPSS